MAHLTHGEVPRNGGERGLDSERVLPERLQRAGDPGVLAGRRDARVCHVVKVAMQLKDLCLRCVLRPQALKACSRSERLTINLQRRVHCLGVGSGGWHCSSAPMASPGLMCSQFPLYYRCFARAGVATGGQTQPKYQS